jgi:hypothetical protein
MKDLCLLAACALAASVAQTAHAQITEATSPAKTSATRTSDTSADAQARGARSSNQPGPFGVGAEMGFNPEGEVGFNPGGIEPSILYDFKRSFTLHGMVDLGSGYSAVTGQLLYRFVLRDQPQRVRLTPYAGGGPILITVDYGGPIGSHGFTGLLASGGVFITVKTIPRWRFSADLNTLLYRHSGFPQPAFYGLWTFLRGKRSQDRAATDERSAWPEPVFTITRIRVHHGRNRRS